MNEKDKAILKQALERFNDGISLLENLSLKDLDSADPENVIFGIKEDIESAVGDLEKLAK